MSGTFDIFDNDNNNIINCVIDKNYNGGVEMNCYDYLKKCEILYSKYAAVEVGIIDNYLIMVEELLLLCIKNKFNGIIDVGYFLYKQPLHTVLINNPSLINIL